MAFLGAKMQNETALDPRTIYVSKSQQPVKELGIHQTHTNLE